MTPRRLLGIALGLAAIVAAWLDWTDSVPFHVAVSVSLLLLSATINPREKALPVLAGATGANLFGFVLYGYIADGLQQIGFVASILVALLGSRWSSQSG